MTTALALIILLPLAGALLMALLGGMMPRRLAETLGCGVVWGSFASALTAAILYTGPQRVELAGWLEGFNLRAPISLYLDSLSLAMILMITFVCGLIHLYSVAYMAEDPCHIRFFALLNLFVAAMLILVLAENLPLLYLGWEGVGFCSYGLIGFWYKQEKNATAARKAFIVTRIGDVGFGIAIVWLFQLTGTLSVTAINAAGPALPASAVTAIGLLLLAGAMGKSAQLPLSVWLPDAMAGPTPVSALIHAATMVTAGVYLLLRLSPLVGGSGVAMAAIAVTGGLTAFYGASCALAQRDLKRVLAYSTISQIGYMMLGVGAGAIVAATFHLIVHAFFKALLFLAAGCVITAMHHEQDMFRMGGLRQSHPAIYRLFVAGALCLAGFPLTGGFFSKDSILAALWERGGLYGNLYFVGLLTAFITAYYTFRMVCLVFGGRSGKTGTVPPLMVRTLFPLALLGLAGGILNIPPWLGRGLLAVFMAPLATVSAHNLSTGAEAVLQLVASVTAICGVLLAIWHFGAARRDLRVTESSEPATGLTALLLHGWYLDRLYDLLFVRPFKYLSGFLWQRVDIGVIDRGIDNAAFMLGRCGTLLGRWSCGRVSIYLLSFAACAALLLGYLAWVVLMA